MSRRWRTTDVAWVALAVVATVGVAVLSFVFAPPSSAPEVEGSSYSVHAGGAGAVYLALKGAGYRVERWFEPLVQLDRREPDSILVLVDPQTMPSEQDRAALERFVSRGGTLFAAGPTGMAFLPQQPFRRDGARPSSGSEAMASLLSPLTRGVPEVRMAPPRASLSGRTSYLPVYGDARTPFVLEARIGEGRVLWWSDGWPLSNSGIGQRGHAELLANMLGPPAEGRLILWDEHYHGFTRSLWSYMAGTPIPYAILQLGFVFAAFLFAFARRRAPVRPLVDVPRTSPLEFVDSMGALYERAGVTAGAVETVRVRARRAMLAATGLPASADDVRVSHAVAARTGMDASTIVDLLARSERAAHAPRLAAEEARSLVAGLQDVVTRLSALAPGRLPRSGRP